MGKEEGYNISELGNWNVASDFSRIKIMKPLALCDIYENIAKFGYDTILDQLGNYSLPRDVLMLEGYYRLVNELLKLIGNSKFAMKKPGTKDDLMNYEKELQGWLEIMPLLSKTIYSQRKGTRTLTIVQPKFDKALKEVLKIKSSINEPLNKNNLIFTDKEEFDPKAYKKGIFDDAISRG